MFISVDETDKIAPVIEVLGVRKDAKKRKWSLSVYDGIPQTGEYSNYFHGASEIPGTKNAHFVYKANMKIGDIRSHSGTAYFIDAEVLHGGRYRKIAISTNSFNKLIRGIANKTIPIVDYSEMVVEVKFILEKYGRYVMAEIIEDESEWI
ncbi:hypothetical protein Aeh1ORF306c [Aeromonas phage Aeh1]|uniref:Uncharacterized protein n=1 Tax=Aeromonas phage Aeh1 TaxID=2880362 RepID=Q76YC0_9CAUD|nr:hypothetical protein Aeh1p325 [Aeromonas phage Aeh1]AAQ17975.1 hypothetical protein Aeh1ORF306c [Aeromonas phage Aeh1]